MYRGAYQIRVNREGVVKRTIIGKARIQFIIMFFTERLFIIDDIILPVGVSYF